MPNKTEAKEGPVMEVGGADSLSAAALPPSMEVVTLAVPHTHGGKQHKAGDEIEVSPSQKIWLGKRGIIDIDPQPEKPTEGE